MATRTGERVANTLRSWHFNRRSSITSKIFRWSKNPIGAIIRLLEFTYFRVPLVSLLKSFDHFREVSHINTDIQFNSNALILPKNSVHLENNLILLRSGHILFVKLSYQSFLSGLHSNEIRRLQRSVPSQEFENAIALPKQEYFYHFVIEYLPEILRLSMDRENSYVLTIENQPKFVTDYLSILRIPTVLVSDPIVRLVNSSIPTNLEGNNFQILLNAVNSFVPAEVLLSPPKILILRRGLSRDDSSLNQALVDYFLSKGFSEIVMQDLSVVSQINLFRNAREIVAIHGGALTNLIYCTPGTRILEVFSGSYRNFDFERISNLMKYEYTGLDSSMLDGIKEWSLD